MKRDLSVVFRKAHVPTWIPLAVLCASSTAWALSATHARSWRESRPLPQKQEKQEKRPAGRPWVLLQVSVSGWSPSFAQSVAADLSAGLERSGIQVATSSSRYPKPPLARVILSRPSTPAGQGATGATKAQDAIQIEITDGVTSKKVTRRLDMGHFNQATQSLGVALAAEELLRASWAELALSAMTTAPKRAAPPAVKRLVKRSLKKEFVVRQALDQELGWRPMFDYYSGGVMQYGGDMEYLLWLHPRVGLLVALGGRNMIPAESGGGKITGYGIVMTLGAVGAILPPGGRFRLDGAVRLSGLWLHFNGNPVPGYDGNSVNLGGMRLVAEIRPTIRVSRGFFLAAHVGGGGTLLGINLLDTGKTVQRLFGGVVSAGISASIRW